MKVTLTEAGGFANIKRGCSIDTRTLPPETAERLEKAICDGALFVEHRGAPNARDARTIVIEVECGTSHRRTSFSEAAVPVTAQPVLEILRPLCRIIPTR